MSTYNRLDLQTLGSQPGMPENLPDHWSETTLNYWMMVARYPNLKEEVGGSIPGREISSLLEKTWRWSGGLQSQKNYI